MRAGTAHQAAEEAASFTGRRTSQENAGFLEYRTQMLHFLQRTIAAMISLFANHLRKEDWASFAA
jgi:hypothetical protein